METIFKEVHYPNGELSYKNQLLHGKLHGEQLGYYKNGKLEYKWQYLNGKRHGEQLTYHENGELWYKDYYINGVEVLLKKWICYSKPQHQTQSLTDMYV